MNPNAHISKPPDFPRPSSATRSRLQNRLVRRTNAPNVPNVAKRNDEHTSHVRNEIKSIMKSAADRGARYDSSDIRRESEAAANAVLGSSAWPDEHEVSVLGEDGLSEESILHMKSTIIQSHSLAVPGMESLVFRRSSDKSISSSRLDSTQERFDISLTSSNFINVFSRQQGLDQAIQMIMSGQQEFCYLEPVDPTNPYRLALSTSPKDKHSSRYITLSKTGIIRYGWGEPDRITLREFVREYYLYHMAVKIPFIVKFWKWKTFFKLQAYTLQCRRARVMRSLLPRLFLLDPIFQKMLLYCARMCAVLRDRESVRLGNHLICDISRLVDLLRQMTLADNEDSVNGSSTPESKRSNVIHIDDTVSSESGKAKCQSIGNSAAVTIDDKHYCPLPSVSMSKKTMLGNLIGFARSGGEKRTVEVLTEMPTVLSASSYFHYQQTHDLITAVDMDSRSLVRNTQSYLQAAATVPQEGQFQSSLLPPPPTETPLSFTERAAIRLNCRQFANALRMMDFMLRDTLYVTVERALDTFMKKLMLLHNGETDDGQILVALTLRDTRGDFERQQPALQEDLQLVITPNKEAVTEGLSTSMDELLNAGIHSDILLHHMEFAELLKPIQGEIKDSAVDDLVFLDTRNSLHILVDNCAELILDDMDQCVKEMSNYTFLSGMYASTDIEESELTLETLAKMSISELSEGLCAINSKMETLRNLPIRVDLGIVRLDIRHAVKYVYNKLVTCKNKYYERIPRLFVSVGEDIYNRAHAVKAGLLSTVTGVDDFVKVIEVYRSAVSSFDDLEERHAYHRSLKEIMDEHGIPVSDEIFGLTATLRTEYQLYVEAIAAFEESKEDKIKNYRRDLVTRAKNLGNPINDIEVRLGAELLSDPESDAEIALSEVRDLDGLFAKLSRETARVSHCQKVMETFVYDEIPVQRIQHLLRLYRCLWGNVQKLQDLQEGVYSAKLADVDCVHVLDSLKAVKKRLLNLAPHDSSPVELWLLRAIADLDGLVPVLLQLQAKTLVARHQDRIDNIVGAKIFGGSCSSVRDIQNLDILKYAAEIQVVHHRSVCEFNLLSKLQELRHRLDTQRFCLLSHPTLKAFTSIENLASCWDNLQDIGLTVKSAMSSKFIDFIEEEYTQFLDKIDDWKILLKRIATLEKDNIRLRVMFTSARSTRYIHQALRFFNVADECWRHVIKNIRGDDMMCSLLSMPDIRTLVENAIESLALADKVVDRFVSDQRNRYPRFYLLSQAEVYSIHSMCEMDEVFEKCRPTMFQGLTGIDMGSHEGSQDIDAVFSGSEVFSLKTPCSTRGTIGDWMRHLESCLSEKLQDDVISLVTDTRQVMEDARNPICCNQARILALQIKFWTDLKQSMEPANAFFKGKMQTMLQLEVNDQITVLMTLLSTAKSSHHIISLSNMLLCMLQCRDIISGIIENTNDAVEIDSNDFMLDCAIQKQYNAEAGVVLVRHSLMSKQYAMVYQGFQQKLVITPMTTRCYLAISASFSASYSAVPLLRGTAGSGKRCLLQEVTNEFGQDVSFVDCRYEGSSAERLSDFVHGATRSKLHMCFLHAESLAIQNFSLMVTAVAAAHMVSAFSAVSLRQDPQGLLFSRPHFSICMNVQQSFDVCYFPASIRQKFRPLHVTAPPLLDVLSLFLQAYGFSNPSKSAMQLSTFVEHVCVQCGIDPGIMTHLMVRSSIPRVSMNIQNNNKIESAQQCYLILRDMFRRLPKHLHGALDLENIKYSCQIFLGITFDIKLNDADFKGREYDPLRMLKTVISTDNSVLLVGPYGCGKSALIWQAVGNIEGYVERGDDDATAVASGSAFSNDEERLPKRLYPYVINPLLISQPQCVKKYSAFEETEPQEDDEDALADVLLCNREIASRRQLDGVEGLLTDISNDKGVTYVHLDVPDCATLLEYGRRLNHFYDYSAGSKGRLKLIWECCDISDVDPAFVLSIPIVFVAVPTFQFEDVLNIHKNYFLERFSGNIYDSRLQKALTFCLDTFVCPWMQLCGSLGCTKESTLRSFFKIASCMYMQSDLSLTAELSNPEKSKSKWDLHTFYRIVVFSAIWTIGVSSESMCRTLETWLFDNVIEGKRFPALVDVFPPTAEPFEYILRRPDEDSVQQIWVSWSNATDLIADTPEENVRSAMNQYCTAFEYDTSEFMVHNRYTVALNHIQRSLLEFAHRLNARKSEDPTLSIALCGPSGVGKSSVMYHMISAARMHDRWLAILREGSSAEVLTGIRSAQNISRTCFIEHALPFRGAVFVDDFSFAADTASSVNHSAELFRSLHDNQAYFDPNQNGWTSSQHFYSVLCGATTDAAPNIRLLQNALVMMMSPEESFLPSVLGAKMHKMCPFMKLELAVDMAQLTVKMYEHFIHLDTQGISVSPLVKTCPASWKASTLLRTCRSFLIELPVVSSNEVGNTWKRALNIEYSGSVLESQIYMALDKILGDSAFNNSAMKPLLAQGHGLQRKMKSPRFASTVSLRRMSALKGVTGVPAQLSGPELAKELSELQPTQVENVHVGLMTLQELRDSYVNSCVKKQSVHDSLDVELVDTGNAGLWKDIQKCCVFLSTPGQNAIALGSTLPVVNTVLKISCSICDYSYNTHLLDNDMSLEYFTQRVARGFCMYLLQQRMENAHLPMENFAVPTTLMSVVNSKSYADDYGDDRYSKPSEVKKPALWHLHLERREGYLCESEWMELFHIVNLGSSRVIELLGGKYGIYPRSNSVMRRYLVKYITSVRLIVTFGPYANVMRCFTELSFRSSMASRMSTIHFLSQYGLNQDMLSRVFTDFTTETVMSSIVDIVTTVRDNEVLESSPFVDALQSPEYTQGTYDMIVKIFDAACDDALIASWQRHMAMYVKLTSIYTTTPPVDVEMGEREDIITVVDMSASVQRYLMQTMSDILFAVLHTRYASACPRSRREDLTAVICTALREANAGFIPQFTDSRGVVYSYCHTLCESGKVESPKLQRFVDMLLVGGSCIESVSSEYCAVVLAVLTDSAVRVGGSSHFVSQLLGALMDLKVVVTKSPMPTCESIYNLDHEVDEHEEAKAGRGSSSIEVVESLLYFNKANRGVFDIVNLSTTVVLFSMSGTVCSDTMILFYLAHGGYSDRALCESWQTLHGAITSARDRPNFSAAVSEFLSEGYVYQAASKLLALQWKYQCNDVAVIVKCLNCFVSSINGFSSGIYSVVPDRIFQVLTDILRTEQKSLTLRKTIEDILTNCFVHVTDQLSLKEVYRLKTIMMLRLLVPKMEFNSSCLEKLIANMENYQGNLGFTLSKKTGRNLVLTQDSVVFLSETFAYINCYILDQPLDRNLSVDHIRSALEKHSSELEQWTNVYSYADFNLPVSSELKANITPVHQLMILITVKPIAVSAFIDNLILSKGEWAVPPLNVMGDVSHHEQNLKKLRRLSAIEIGFLPTLVVYHNPTGVIDTYNQPNPRHIGSLRDSAKNSKTVKLWPGPLYVTAEVSKGEDDDDGVNRRYRSGTISGGLSVDAAEKYNDDIIIADGPVKDTEDVNGLPVPAIPSTHAVVALSNWNHSPEKDLLPLLLDSDADCAVECSDFINISYRDEMADKNRTVTRGQVDYVCMQNYTRVLEHTVSMLVMYHEQHADSVSEVTNRRITRPIARCYWIYAFFHTAVLLRVDLDRTSIGDDTVKQASRMITKIHLFSNLSPEKTRIFMQHLCFELYQVLTADYMTLQMMKALFDNFFTRGSLNTGEPYYLLGVSPLPEAMEREEIDDFLVHIHELVDSGSDDCGLIDLLVCTSGELSEQYRRNVVGYDKLSSVRSCHTVLPAAELPSILRELRPSVNRDVVTRVTICLERILRSVPAPIEVDLGVASMQGAGALTGKGDFIQKRLHKSPIAKPKRSRKATNTGSLDDRLWKVLLLEIACFNSSVRFFSSFLRSLMCISTCPSTAAGFLYHLEKGLVPPTWLKLSADQAEPRVSLDEWFQQMKDRRQMLSAWHAQKQPENLRLQLLQNPNAFFFVLKQALGERVGASVETVKLECRLVCLPTTAGERNALLSKIAISNNNSSAANYTVVVSSAVLVNAVWEDDKYCLGFMHPSTSSRISQEVCLTISATLEDTNNPDDYECPLFAFADMPTSENILQSPTQKFNPDRKPLLIVSVPSTCDPAEWAKRKVALYCCPPWQLPG